MSAVLEAYDRPDYAEAIHLAIRTCSALMPAGFTAEDIEACAPDVPSANVAATVASWASRGLLISVGERIARKPSSKGRSIDIYLVS